MKEERLRRTMFFFRILQKEIWIYLAFFDTIFKALLILFCPTDIKNILKNLRVGLLTPTLTAKERQPKRTRVVTLSNESRVWTSFIQLIMKFVGWKISIFAGSRETKHVFCTKVKSID